MNQLFKLSTILFFSTVLISCGDGSHNHTAHEHESHSEAHADHGHDLNENSDLSIELINGNKWLVNDEMKPHVQQGEKALNAYLASASTDYKSLAEELRTSNQNLIASCTMQGQSHDELHKWLHPHLTLVSDLEKSGTDEEASEVIEKLTASYKSYHTYFQ